MSRRYLLAAALLAIGAALVLYGLLDLLHNGDEGGGATTVTLAGHRLDAHLVGAFSLAAGLALAAAGVAILRRR